CWKARNGGFQYTWIHTCCIGKINSVQLSEPINSICQWFKNSIISYAHLTNVPTRYSRWFTRGCILQVPIAPNVVECYAEDWLAIGAKPSL
ncbi:hypothetical protein BGZ60DRAFT_374917, partial [Tricladium varicosporioides]